MTDEELATIRIRARLPIVLTNDPAGDRVRNALQDRDLLLAEIERLRAENAAWREIVQRVAGMDGMICTCYHTKHADQECIVTAARALLAAGGKAGE